MNDRRQNIRLSNAEVQAIFEDAERQAYGGWGGAVARAGLGTLALVLAAFATMDPETVGLVVLCSVSILVSAVFVRSMVRSSSVTDHANSRRTRPTGGLPAQMASSTPVTDYLGRTAGSWSSTARRSET